jgi:fumarate hydratase, class II
VAETDYRIEKDSLGEVRVPTSAYWGAQTQRAVENFPISGLRQYPAFIWAMAMIKRAAAEVNDDLGLFEDREIGANTTAGSEIARAIRAAADEVARGEMADQFVVDPIQAGAGTSHNMNVNEVIANRANEILGYAPRGDGQAGAPQRPRQHGPVHQRHHPHGHPVGRLWRLDELVEALDELAEALRERAGAFDDVVKSGRTHLQDAVPVRMGQEFGAYARAVERDREKIVAAAEGLRRLGIGGTATGSG